MHPRARRLESDSTELCIELWAYVTNPKLRHAHTHAAFTRYTIHCIQSRFFFRVFRKLALASVCKRIALIVLA
jgi:hypothetical protein